MALEVVMVDHHRLTLEGMRHALDRVEDVTVVATAVTAAELLAVLKRTAPDVVLMGADLPDMDGLKCLGLVRQNYPAVKIGVLFADKDMSRIESALQSGAAACLMKNVHPDDLGAAVRQVVDATVYTAVCARPPLAPQGDPQTIADLTDRERTMLDAIARGLSNKAISREQWVTEQTVKFHLNNVYRKLGVPNRTAAARYAFDHGLAGSAQPARGAVSG